MNEEIRGLMSDIEDLKNQVVILYNSAYEMRAEFDEESDEYAMIDEALNHMGYATDELDAAVDELKGE